jgi:hypothetical protein
MTDSQFAATIFLAMVALSAASGYGLRMWQTSGPVDCVAQVKDWYGYTHQFKVEDCR